MIAFWNIRLLFAIPLTLILAFLFHGQLWGSPITPIAGHAEYSTAIDEDGGTVYGKLASSPRILQTTMLLGDQSNNITERCVQTHLDHGDKWGYKTIVLRRDFMAFEHQNGANSNYPKLLWDKALHMLSLLLDELKKPDDVRAEWLIWFDSDTILLNPNIPWSLFLPAANYLPNEPPINYIASYDPNGLNSGLYMIRVTPWAVRYLTSVSSLSVLRPDAELASNTEQNWQRWVLQQPDFGAHAIFQPDIWYQKVLSSWLPDPNPQAGDMQVHFAGLREYNEKLADMELWLGRREEMQRDKEHMPLRKSGYPEMVEEYWALTAQSKDAVRLAFEMKAGEKWAALDDGLKQRIEVEERALREILVDFFWKPDELRTHVANLDDLRRTVDMGQQR